MQISHNAYRARSLVVFIKRMLRCLAMLDKFHRCLPKMAKYDEDRLKINDRVVHVFPHGPEFGTVRWIGSLEKLDRALTMTLAGIEFVNLSWHSCVSNNVWL